MKKLLFIYLVFSSQILAQYTTPNTGANWNLDSLVINSAGVVTGIFPNYSLNNKIIISANDKINIQAGSKVNVTSATGGFEINGILNSIGTETDSIIFTSIIQDSTGFYEGFRFNQNTSSDTSIIKFTKIFFADYGFRCIGVSPVLSNSHLYKCGRGIQLSTSNAKIINNLIERSYEYGVTMTLGSSPIIDGNILKKNNTRGVSSLNQISIGLQGNNSPVITNNIIEGGESVPTGGISLWVSGASSFSNAVIKSNTILNNSFGITLYSTSDGLINTYVSDNLIYNNNVNPNAQVSGSGININGTSFNRPIITRNTIYGNWWGITVQNGTTVQPGPQPRLGNLMNTDTTDDGYNIIYNNIQGTNVFDLYNNCTNDIYAQNNDWRMYDSLSIENHVYHKIDNPAHGLIIYMPFSSTIPVELSIFSATINNAGVILDWTTGSEKNNHGFTIERSFVNQQHPAGSWESIGFVGGRGTITTPTEYQFIDVDVRKLNTNHVKYRLLQIDFSGTSSYSGEVDVWLNMIPDIFYLGQNYPNPFNPSTRIKYQVSSIAPVTLKIYDILGNETATLVDEVKEAGSYEVEFRSSVGSLQLASGVYYYQLKAGNFMETKKMLLLR